jgi:hypothetical protein
VSVLNVDVMFIGVIIVMSFLEKEILFLAVTMISTFANNVMNILDLKQLTQRQLMDKILSDGTVLTKARFWRTTCKQCRKELPKSVIMNEGKFCNKLCRFNWNRISHKVKGYSTSPMPDLDAEYSHCDMVEQNY